MGGLRVTESEADAMVAKYLAGKSLAEAAAPRPAQTLRCILIARGITRRAKHTAGMVAFNRQREQRSALCRVRWAAIVNDYRDGHCVQSLAKRHGVTAKTVRVALKEGGISTGYFKTVNHGYFESITDEQRAYWLGFLAGDGCVTGHNVALTLARCDRGHVMAFREQVGSTHKVHDGEKACRFTRPDGRSYESTVQYSTLQFRSTRMVSDLTRHGVGPRKSLHALAWDGPDELLRHWMRGIVDADGWIVLPSDRGGRGHRTNLRIGLCGSESCVRAFAEYGQRIADGAAVAIEQPRCEGLFRAAFGGSVAQLLIRDLYSTATVSLPRKREKALAALALVPRDRAGRRGPSPSSPMR